MAGSASQHCHDLAPSFDTCGYFSRDGETFARVGEVLLGADRNPLPEKPRLLLARDAFALLDRAVREALAPAIRQIEAVLGKADETDVATEGFTALYWAMRYIQGREAWIVDGPMIERLRPPLGPRGRRPVRIRKAGHRPSGGRSPGDPQLRSGSGSPPSSATTAC